MQTILDLSFTKARKYFMEPENYCTLGLPKYVDFSEVLRFVQAKVNTKDLNAILVNKNDKPSNYDGVNYKILKKKDEYYAYRTMQVPNPYLYYLLVKKMTSKAGWNEIKNRFKKFYVPQIEVASLPKVKGDVDRSHLAAEISHWWDGVEQRSLELALQFRYMFVSDITNCYPSMYTHSIAWALMGKVKAKAMKGKGGHLGNEIDNYIQGMQYGQTNGIPQGSAMFDFIAEIILGYTDKILSLWLKRENINDYKIIRYRDDYRIFSNSSSELERISFLLQKVLGDLNLQLNSKKTKFSEDLISDSIKTDKIQYISNNPLYYKNSLHILTMASSLQQEAVYIHQFAKKFPNSGTLVKLLTLFSKRLRSQYTGFENKTVIISIFTDIALDSPKVYKHILHIISWLLSKYSTTEEREKIVKLVYSKFLHLPNIGELQIWLQRITFKLPHPIDYTEKICKIVANEPSIKLWNNDWIKAEFKADFPESSICNVAIRDALTPVISVDEISLFDVY